MSEFFHTDYTHGLNKGKLYYVVSILLLFTLVTLYIKLIYICVTRGGDLTVWQKRMREMN